jgi:hypothetical protein
MSNGIKCFRTISRCGIFRQSTDNNGATILTPVAMAVPPQQITINPGDQIDEPKELALDGREVTSFTYPKGQAPELDINFGMATLDVESIIHGRDPVALSGGNVEGWQYVEFLATSTTPYPARAVGQLGKGTPAQDSHSKALFWYIDPATKLAHKMTVLDATASPAPTPSAIDEIEIGADIACSISTPLAATGYQVYGWVPNSFTAGTVLSAKPTGLFQIVAQGISYDNKARLFMARNCTRLTGQVGADSTRQLKFRVLPDPADGTGLGYSIIDLPTLNVV